LTCEILEKIPPFQRKIERIFKIYEGFFAFFAYVLMSGCFSLGFFLVLTKGSTFYEGRQAFPRQAKRRGETRGNEGKQMDTKGDKWRQVETSGDKGRHGETWEDMGILSN
jgi:hypothetical protein